MMLLSLSFSDEGNFHHFLIGATMRSGSPPPGRPRTKSLLPFVSLFHLSRSVFGVGLSLSLSLSLSPSDDFWGRSFRDRPSEIASEEVTHFPGS